MGVKEIIKLIIIAIVMYLIGCFSQADFNISKWNESTKAGIAIIYGFISLIFLMTDRLKDYDETN